jgi:hypothetical protein
VLQHELDGTEHPDASKHPAYGVEAVDQHLAERDREAGQRAQLDELEPR